VAFERSDIRCGVICLQGDFACHKRALERLGVPCREVRRAEQLEGLTHVILPGGESTTLYRLGKDYGLLEPFVEKVRKGLAVFGTCAGAILLGSGPEPPPRLCLVPVTVIRNAYGRQRESFTTPLRVSFLREPVKGIFIRAPRITEVPAGAGVEILAYHNGDPVLIRFNRLLLCTFHPELTDNVEIHKYFLSL